MYIRKNILFFVLAFSLVMASATASAEEENMETQSITKIKETEEAEISTLFSDSPEEQEPEVIEPGRRYLLLSYYRVFRSIRYSAEPFPSTV